jgi:hypothetical protein
MEEKNIFQLFGYIKRADGNILAILLIVGLALAMSLILSSPFKFAYAFSTPTSAYLVQ